MCWVFLGRCDTDATPNTTEIAAVRFISVDELEAELKSQPSQFTPWIKLEWDCLRTEHADLLQTYISPRS